jgi:asparagine synthase (glutamine-hydrolysing)
MCGIFGLLQYKNDIIDTNLISKNFMKGKSRGPENSKLERINDNLILGFHRLAINGLNNNSMQPLNIDGVILICNGEIYNYKQIYSNLNYEPVTESDCEAIIPMYKKYGIKYTLENLDGVFSFILFDLNTNIGYIARDPFGVRPLYFGRYRNTIYFSSLLKQISNLCEECSNFKAGSYVKFRLTNRDGKYLTHPPVKYTNFNYNMTNRLFNIGMDPLEQSFKIIYNNLFEAVKKRVITMDTNLACLLSGGLDSSLITALVAKFVPSGQLQTYSIGMPGGSDLQYAKKVANHINSNHTEIIISENEFLQNIGEVIYQIESYDTTTVRASVGNYLVAKYISENSDAKVIFNGDGSDELTGGYMYFHNCPNNIEFDYECKRLLKDIQYFDVLRSDRTISCHGLEARTPFLDRSFVHNYLSLPIEHRNFNTRNGMEKWLLRKSFEVMDNNLLPTEVLWRTKEAFSDGVSSVQKSWYEIIQEHLEDKYTEQDLNESKIKYQHNPPQTKEQLYYREIFEKYYASNGNVIPYFWMPKYTDSKDASARSLDVYKKQMNLETNIEE